ncbi:hypothetical protein [Symbiobacterium terraclitae]|uniref:hypothetical protein n=1 Tax=Symbiobacterium terraclitae TaxID=557451 RepID=UPI0035B55B5B
MTRPFTASLAVARLAELSPARSHRREAGRPMQGYCLITCDADFSRVTLYVENGQTLTDRSGTGGFYYEGWLVGPSGAVSLGAFNVGADGQGSATRTVASSQAQPGRAELVRVTVEPFGGTEAGNISVLEGRLIWLDAATAFPAWPAGGPGDWASRAAAAGLSATPPQAQALPSPTPQAPSGTVAATAPSGGSSGGSGGAVEPFTADYPAGLARQFGGDSPAGLSFESTAPAAGASGGGSSAASASQAVASSGTSASPSDASSGSLASPSAAAFGGSAHPSGGQSGGAAFESGTAGVASAGGWAAEDGAAPVGVAVQPGSELSVADQATQPGASAPYVAQGIQAGAERTVAGQADLPGASAGESPDGLAAASGGPAAALAPERPEGIAGAQANRADTPAAGGGDASPVQAQPAPSRVNPLTVQVQLVQRHPMTPRASGSATLNLRRGSMTINLRGLPSPMALGRDRTTGRPFNAYRVWLVNQRNQIRTPVGYCERAWGENFRFQADGLPLNRNDTILVTVEDRSAATSTGHASPQVLIGSYEP